MLALRKSREQILTALKWCRLITKYLEPSQPDDDLLANLYWNMKLLANIAVPFYAADWRFLRRWLSIWGLAPEYKSFLARNRFTDDEILILSFVAQSDTKRVIEFFSRHKDIPAEIFMRALDLSARLLNVK